MLTFFDWLSDAPQPGPNVVLTIGVFDGLHLGHQFLIKSVISRAQELGVASLLLTFEPHPLTVLSSNAAPEILTTFDQKRDILETLGLSILGCLRFTEELSKQEPLVFLNQVLVPRVKPIEILVGPDFHFGKDAEGNFALLEEWAKGWKIKLHKVPIQEALEGETLASSRARGLLKLGFVESASKILGRFYRLTGTVIPGQKRGRTLGFPTANLGNLNQLIPGPGVYAVMAILGGKKYPAMTSIGQNPTFKGSYLTVETYIFDFAKEFYGEELSLDFVRRIRGMIRFDSVKALVAELKEDEKKARNFLKEFE
jgi:riboflavin kinase/FMN adenylyltransferase